MVVLSVHEGHDAGASLLVDGRLVMHSSEERRRNKKNYAGFPDQSISTIFKKSGVSPKDVDLVALSGKLRILPPSTSKDNYVDTMMRVAHWATRHPAVNNIARSVLEKLRSNRDALRQNLANMGVPTDRPLIAYDHHLTHAATAYYHRPWAGDALVLTHDGAGDGLCATVSVGRGNELQVVDQVPKFNSIANCLYSYVTAHLGLKPWEHEYKVMGMAPYGQAEYTAPIFRQMFDVVGTQFKNRTGRIGSPLGHYMAKKLYRQRFDNICAGAQAVFEELTIKWVKNAIAKTGVKKVACAGGAFLNVKANKLIRELPEVEAFFAYPASDDGGTPVGAAILGYFDLCKMKGAAPNLQPRKDMYLGLSFTDDECEAALKGSGLNYQKMTDAPRQIAQILAEGMIVGRFAGGEEVGPRALGNRTIMADARDLRVIRKLNFAIKQRDFWMPFAASVLEEEAHKYIKDLKGWPYYMIEAFDTTPAAATALLAGMHPFDMTIRPQLVNDLNPGYRDIIRAFRDITGVGGVLNTSFNLHGSPIVGSPQVAIETFKNSQLDVLVLESFLVTKPESLDRSQSESAAHSAARSH